MRISSVRARQHPTRDSRMSEDEKEGPARQKEDCLASLVLFPVLENKGVCGGLSSYQPY